MEKYGKIQSSVFKNCPKSLRGDIISGCPLCPLPDTRIGYLSEATTLQHKLQFNWNPFGHPKLQGVFGEQSTCNLLKGDESSKYIINHNYVKYCIVTYSDYLEDHHT